MAKPYRTGVKEIQEEDFLVADHGIPTSYIEPGLVSQGPMEVVEAPGDTQGNSGWTAVKAPTDDNDTVEGVSAQKGNPFPGGGWN